MKHLAVTIVLFFSVFIVSAQNPCLPEGITFSSQAQIDNFQVDYPGCTQIEGNVFIAGPDISNLNGLNGLTAFLGGLYIGTFSLGGNPGLTDLQGLNNVVWIGTNILVGYNDNLIGLNGLENLSNVGINLWIYENPALQSMNALENLISVKSIDIFHNNSLVNLSGLENITALQNGLDITGNESLTSFEGLNNLDSIGSTLLIEGNVSLADLTGLEGLTFIGSSLVIKNNDSLTSLTGLDNLTHINGPLAILSNKNLDNLFALQNLTYAFSIGIDSCFVLTSLSGLDNIDPGSIFSLGITYNSSLSECHVQSLCDYLEIPDANAFIHENATGCNSVEEVEEACEPAGIRKQNFQLLTIHPNPTDKGFITITLDNPHILQLSCFNTFGQQVYQQEIQAAETVINVSTWSPGIYLVVVYEEGKPVGRSKFVVRY